MLAGMSHRLHQNLSIFSESIDHNFSMVSVAVCVDCWYIFSLFVFCWPQCLPSSLPRLSFSQFLSNTSLLSCPCLDSSHCSIFWILTLDLNERNNVLGFQDIRSVWYSWYGVTINAERILCVKAQNPPPAHL